MQNFPEVELAGLTKGGSFELVLRNGNTTIFTKNFIQVDYNAAKILGLKPTGGLERPAGKTDRLNYLSKERY